MKILLGADQYPEYINGAANFTSRLAAGLARAGHTVDLLWPSVEGRHHSYVEQDVRIHRLSSIALPGRPRMYVSRPRQAARQVEQIIQATKPDVVHVQSHLMLGRSLLRAARCVGVPVLATNHFMPDNLLPHVPVLRRFPEWPTKLAWRDLERVYAGADLLTAPTQRAVDLLAATTSLPPAHVVSCGLDLARYRSAGAAEATSQGPTILFVGRLEPEKHVDVLIDAFAELPGNLDARLVLVGMGSLRRSLQEQVRSRGVAGAVTFTGAIPDEELLQHYARADLFVMPGTAELQSLATLEAMAAGLPIIAADAMALPHLVKPDQNGYLFRPGSVAELAARMQAVLDDRARRISFGSASRRFAERHDLAATVAAFENFYAALATPVASTIVQVERQLAMAS